MATKSAFKRLMSTPAPLVGLMIALVLACPYLCWAEIAGAPMSSLEPICCGVCERNAPDEPAPANPTSDSRRGDCFCRGAVVDALKIESPTAGIGDRWIDALDVSSQTHVPSLVSIITIQPPCHFPLASNGRDICAWTCALLL